jgi:hypothetical protein
MCTRFRIVTGDNERMEDRGRRERRPIPIVRENWYRDVWLLIITVFMVAALIGGIEANDDRIADVQESRFLFQLQSCVNTNGRNLEAKAKAKELPLSANGRVVVVSLVDAMVPFTEDCEAKARNGVKIPDG